jgi:deoxyribonuclease-4
VKWETRSKEAFMLIGSHMSIAGGVDKAFARGESLGLEAMQIFTKNNNQWDGKPLTSDAIDRYFAERERTGIDLVFAHDSYLINLCATDKSILERSRNALLDELKRCDLLDIPYLVIHPGSHMGAGERWGLKKIAASINLVFKKLSRGKAMILLENTAGQGTNLGYRFEHLAEIRWLVAEPKRIGYCFDTCHAFAAGYDIGTFAGCRKVIRMFDETVGLEKLKAFHFNDCKRELGSRVDRHEHIGKGTIGEGAFRFLMKSPRFKNHPMALETPKSEDFHEDLENIALLKALL